MDSIQQELEHLVEKLQWWFCGRFGGKFRNGGPTLPHSHQKDLVSCTLFAINTIEHNVFGHTLGVANPTLERARRFFLTAENQICGSALPAVVHASNEQAGPSHATHSNTNTLPLSQRALKQHAGEGTIFTQRKAKVSINKPKLRQEKVQQEQAEMEGIECERLVCERERTTHRKAETEMMEHERIAREKAEIEKAELNRLERKRIAHEKAETERMELNRLERERIVHEKAQQDKEELEMFEQGPLMHVNDDMGDVQMHDVDMSVIGMVMELEPVEKPNYPCEFLTHCLRWTFQCKDSHPLYHQLLPFCHSLLQLCRNHRLLQAHQLQALTG